MRQSRFVRRSDMAEFLRGGAAISPLILATVPWGLLAGSLAVKSGISPAQSLGMSLLVFAGAAQLVAIGMAKSVTGLALILAATFLVTLQHWLYGLRLRAHLLHLPLSWRMMFGFLLTDELFALTADTEPGHFRRWYALGAGLSFYLSWQLSTLAGVLASHYIVNLTNLGLDFSVVATFVVILVPTIRRRAQLVCALTALAVSVICGYYGVSGALLLSALIAMTVGTLLDGEGA